MIKKLWGALTGTSKVVDNVFDKDKGLLTQVGQWVGHQQFTDEEKAKHSAKMAEAVQNFAVATLKENTDRSKTRRDLANKWFDMHIFFIRLCALYLPVDYLLIKFTDQTEYVLLNGFSSIAFDPWLCSITYGDRDWETQST